MMQWSAPIPPVGTLALGGASVAIALHLFGKMPRLYHLPKHVQLRMYRPVTGRLLEKPWRHWI